MEEAEMQRIYSITIIDLNCKEIPLKVSSGVKTRKLLTQKKLLPSTGAATVAASTHTLIRFAYYTDGRLRDGLRAEGVSGGARLHVLLHELLFRARRVAIERVCGAVGSRSGHQRSHRHEAR